MTTIYVNPLNMKSVDDARYKLMAYKKSLAEFPALYMREVEKVLNGILDGQAPPFAKGMWSSYVKVGGGGFGGNTEFGESSGIGASALFLFDGKVEFIEFGTGIVGEKNHEGINTDWLSKLPPPYIEYNAGPQIQHFEDSNMDYWVYYDEQGRHVTHGQPADPFIYRSVTELMDQYVDIARNVFHKNNIGKTLVLWS